MSDQKSLNSSNLADNKCDKKFQITIPNSEVLTLKKFYESKNLSDCCFIFTQQEDSSQQGRKKKKVEHRIQAHKFVLAATSSVFTSMFYGQLRPAKDSIIIADIAPKVFDLMLK